MNERRINSPRLLKTRFKQGNLASRSHTNSVYLYLSLLSDRSDFEHFRLVSKVTVVSEQLPMEVGII